jgi:hypothetical protein
MVYSIRNYWFLGGICPSAGILKNNISEIDPVSEMCILEYRTMEKNQKPSNPY